MRIQFAQHVAFEDPGAILKWAEARGHEYTVTRFYAGEELPSPENWDWLIIMGGPMSIHDEDEFPWLKSEKESIRNAISIGKIVIGNCLGSQLIAEALGAKVYKNDQTEIGWFPIEWTPDGQAALYLESAPTELPVFHWHGETFDLPEGAVLLASSAACKNQAFAFGINVFAFQFHLEVLRHNILSMIENEEDELKKESPYIQSKTEILKYSHLADKATDVLVSFLNELEHRWSNSM
ncbi:type 1 glutamine amidotransferase [Cohnella lupini]|uniref:GMP synthase-like glutamine amidotransferase n=1 Tax=Cohnella lupini TaxID=1294267 RepID=A0A3D9ICM4_9BACL|nr:type 1 glutamine amidotransferase [Cohnella lupini]RED59405.1 GMP synthase-like glutamine amidotransferase [Cohnella lupini]